MSKASAFMRPEEATREENTHWARRPEELTSNEIRDEVRWHQEQARSLEKELISIKETFEAHRKERSLSRSKVKKLTRKRRKLGRDKESHQRMIAEFREELKKRRGGVDTGR